MKRISIIAVLMFLFILSAGLGMGMSSRIIIDKTPLNRGEFHAEMGIREGSNPIIELHGVFREARRGFIVFGTVEHVDSDRSTRFQGFFMRNQFIIQSSVRNNIVNIIGRFSSYNEDRDIYQGNWRGIVAGYERTSGWISAQLIL